MIKETVLGLVRHLLTAGGTLLASAGLATGGDVELAAGAFVTLVGFAWSVYQKYAAKKAVK
jgi:hypothetical protein